MQEPQHFSSTRPRSRRQNCTTIAVTVSCRTLAEPGSSVNVWDGIGLKNVHYSRTLVNKARPPDTEKHVSNHSDCFFVQATYFLCRALCAKPLGVQGEGGRTLNVVHAFALPADDGCGQISGQPNVGSRSPAILARQRWKRVPNSSRARKFGQIPDDRRQSLRRQFDLEAWPVNMATFRRPLTWSRRGRSLLPNSRKTCLRGRLGADRFRATLVLSDGMGKICGS